MGELCWKCGALPKDIIASVDLREVPSQSSTYLLQSNDIPLETDIPFFRDIISCGQARMDQLDAQIDSLQSTLTKLTRTRGATAEYVRQHRAVISPLRRMPPELLCEIFALAWFSEEDEDTTNTARVPWYLGHICRSWRDAAVSYPPLWCSISTSSEGICPLAMMETQLARSGNALLRVFWRRVEFVDPRCLGLVVAQCGRWHSLCLDCTVANRVSDEDAGNSDGDTEGEDSSMLDWLSPTAGHLAHLERLELVAPNLDLVIPEVFSPASALRKVILTGRNFGTPSPSVSIPWAQLTHYRGSYTMAQHMEILKAAAPTLVECALGVEWIFAHPPEVVTFPHLRRLCVQSYTVLGHFTAPLLETLSSVGGACSITLLAFIRCSSCPLTKLAVTGCDFVDRLVPLLRELTALTCLLIGTLLSNDVTQANLFNALALPEVCPNLASFSFGYNPSIFHMSISDFAADPFFAMANSRLEPGRPCRLKYLRLVYSVCLNWHEDREREREPYIEADIKAQMGMLRDEGLDAALIDYDEFLGWGDFF
ncbi:hypothetical protein C8R47DRAFT_1121027 [Mycena vitilis]|nr:hypothetical protein C8R47DRAFT_1121027 [Mycena vitilis]